MTATPRSLDFHRFLLIGLRTGTLVECDIEKQAHQVIMEAHYDGETWGLATMEDH
jgi:hypothetical protein